MIDKSLADDWTQEGVFADVYGVPVRAYDDVEMLCETKPEGDDASSYFIPAGTTGTVLFFNRRTGTAEIEHDWPEGSFGFTFAPINQLRLYMRNEVKHPRFALSTAQMSYVWDLAKSAASGDWAVGLDLECRSQRLFTDHIDEDEKRTLFTGLLRLAADNNLCAREAAKLTGFDRTFAKKAFRAIRVDPEIWFRYSATFLPFRIWPIHWKGWLILLSVGAVYLLGLMGAYLLQAGVTLSLGIFGGILCLVFLLPVIVGRGVRTTNKKLRVFDA